MRSHCTAVDQDRDLAKLFRAYKRAASRLRDALNEPDTDLSLKFEMHASEGQPVTAAFTPGATVPRLAALLRPFMAGTSQLQVSAIWAKLLATGEVDATTIADVDKAFLAADRLPIAVTVNDRQLTAADVYLAYGEGHYFADETPAKHLLNEMSVGPFGQMVPLLFHDACANYVALVFRVLDVIIAFERKHPSSPVEKAGGKRCIYCLIVGGDFSAEEHVIPESLGGDEIVLTNCVCGKCNNALSTLDCALLEFEPLAMMRTIHLPLTKKGKFPRAISRDADIAKVAPREIRVLAKSGRRPFSITELADGAVKITMQVTGRKRFDPVPLARALFKIGLGLVARDAGPEVALLPRYDAARRFILGDGTMPNHLFIPRQCQPHAQIRTWWLPADEHTLMALDFFGVVFAFNLDATPLALPPEVGPDVVGSFWLGSADEGAAAVGD